MAHTLEETIDLAMKTAILRAHPIGSYYLTEGTENPKDFIGGVAEADRPLRSTMLRCYPCGRHYG